MTAASRNRQDERERIDMGNQSKRAGIGREETTGIAIDIFMRLVRNSDGRADHATEPDAAHTTGINRFGSNGNDLIGIVVRRICARKLNAVGEIFGNRVVH